PPLHHRALPSFPTRRSSDLKLLLSLAPWITLRADTPSAWLTRDSAMQEWYRSDSLRHNRISPPFYFGMVAGGEMLMARAGEFRLDRKSTRLNSSHLVISYAV